VQHQVPTLQSVAGLQGTLSDLPVVSPDPVTAQVMKTLRFISSDMAILPCYIWQSCNALPSESNKKRSF
jgi:phage portal protein BeeE